MNFARYLLSDAVELWVLANLALSLVLKSGRARDASRCLAVDLYNPPFAEVLPGRDANGRLARPQNSAAFGNCRSPRSQSPLPGRLPHRLDHCTEGLTRRATPARDGNLRGSGTSSRQSLARDPGAQEGSAGRVLPQRGSPRDGGAPHTYRAVPQFAAEKAGAIGAF